MRHRAGAAALILVLLAPSFARALDLAAPELAAPDLAVPDLAVPDLAVPDLAGASQAREREGPYLGPKYSWAEMPVGKRVVWDVVAIPANIPRWGTGDWVQVGLLAGAVTGLMLPLEPSGDVALDRWIAANARPRLPTVWSGPMQGALWGSLAVGGLGTWWWAVEHERWDIAQGMSLMGEAVAVTQVYHLAFKLLIGREGPMDGSDEGRVLGPGRGIVYYPAGTPSGHSATLYAVMGAGFAYFDPPMWFQLASHVAVGSLVAFHVVDRRHYLSETLWGSAMGWSIGQWVVRHRASPRHPPDLSAEIMARIVPLPLRDGGGLALVGRF
jgi:hypothetical protein